MDCLKCHNRCLEFKELFFFCKDEKQVFLSIKPEIKEIIFANKRLIEEKESPKKIRIKCGNCHENLGCIIPFGPGRTRFTAFGCDKVKLNHRSFGKKGRWNVLHLEFDVIEKRDSSNFFNVLQREESISTRIMADIDPTINFPSLENLHHFEWFSVCLDKKKQPRKYQIEAFIEVLQRNLVAVMKTGSGKTLIASMFLARMCSLNPEKMGLMIVDRIPLVFQQGDAIQTDTNLRVARICGENKTGYKLKQLNDNRYDVLVVTAGAFFEMVERKMIDINLFCAVVLDECHHVSGNHRYVNVLQMFTKKNARLQPRILGLTASPVNGKSLLQCENRLEKFLQIFPNVKIFCPRLPESDQRIEEITIRKTQYQTQFISKVYKVFMKMCDRISNMVKIKDIQALQQNLLNAHYVLGDLRTIDNEYGESIAQLGEIIKKAILLLNSMVICNIMGTEYGSKMLESSEFSWITGNLPGDVSDRVQRLISTIRGMGPSSKALVFVKTREICRILCDRLQKEFPHLNPEKIVGHGGYDGMDWEFDQKDKIHKFSTDKCNLLVSTSVLEEGLDVASCDLVVCFTGVPSVIKFIQAKGRARKEKSRFYVYHSEEFTNAHRDLQLQEKMMMTAMRKKESSFVLFSEMSRGIMSQIEREVSTDDQLSSLKEKRFQALEDTTDSDFSFVILADLPSNIEPNVFKTKLLEALEECDVFTLSRIVSLNDEAKKIHSVPKNIFSHEALVFLISVKCNQSLTPPETYKAFCAVFPFSIQIESTVVAVWSKAKFPKQVITETSINIRCLKYSLGHFVDKKTVNIGYESSDIERLEFDNTTMKYEYDFDFNSNREASFNYASMNSFVLISISPREVKLTIPLSCPPVLNCVISLFGVPIRERLAICDVGSEIEAFSSYSVMVMEFDASDLGSLIRIVDKFFPVPFYNVHLKINQIVAQRNYDLQRIQHLCNAMWSLRCLEDSRKVCLPPDTTTKVVNIMVGKKKKSQIFLIDRVVQKCCLEGNFPFFYGFHRQLNETFNAFVAVPESHQRFFEDVVPKDHHLVKRAFVTPLRIVHMPSVPVATNRLLRMLINSKYSLVIVSFLEEDFSKLMSDTLQRVSKCISEGVCLNGVQYNFLCSTGSQLREHKGYFIAASYQEILEIRREIIPNPEHFTSVAKYFSRLGIYGTSDKHIFNVDFSSQCRQIDDLKAANNDLFTDGAGKISAEFMESVAQKLSLQESPAALQIRYSGVKGIVIASSKDDPELNSRKLAFRPSMIKFMNPDQAFCVSSSSRLLELNLNREIISLLSSVPTKWGLDTVLLNYQEAALSKYSDMFNSQSIAFDELKDFISSTKIDSIQQSNMEVIDEQFWIGVLQGVYRLRTRYLRTKTNIPLDINTQGCLIMGVPDPYGVLEEGEVFVQLKNGNSAPKVLEGRILVFRNPCLHPGDCPTVKGVCDSRLMHLLNVIVFPTKGSKSLPATCSGGDLDGDLYGVIWDKNLIPPENLGYHPPCDYTELARPPTTQQDEAIDVNSQLNLAKFFTQFMANDCLGRIATKHLSVSDQLEQGARNPLAIELAKAQSQAVDYPKTGIVPLIPKEVVRMKKFPDFMEKNLKESYLSKNILGVLYRRCRSLAYGFEDDRRPINALFNMNLFVKGHKDYLEDAATTYILYAVDMEILLRRFQLKVEADIILGQATFGWTQYFEANRGKASNAITLSYAAIVEKYRAIFFKDITTTEEKHQKASAWYRVVNDPEIVINGLKPNSKRFLSFPWAVTDILCEVRKAKDKPQISRRMVTIGENARELFIRNSHQLSHTITEKLKKAKEIENAVNRFMKENYKKGKDVFLIDAYGSTSMYLCETESDIDVSVLVQKQDQLLDIQSLFPEPTKFLEMEERKQNTYFLQNIVSRAVDTVAASKREVFTTEIPIIKCSFQDGDKETQCDVSMNKIGYQKTLYMRFLYQQKAYYLPLFWILVRWARVSGLIKSTISSDKIMDSAEFYALIIHILETPDMKDSRIQKPTRWSGIKMVLQNLNQMSLDDFFELGRGLSEFFRKASLLEGNLELVWPTPNIPTVKFDQSKTEAVKNLAGKAFHALSATRDVNALINYFLVTSNEKNTIRKTLPLNVSYAIGKARSFHASRLSEITGAVVTLEVKEGRNNLELRAEGSRMAIENLQNELKALILNNKALVLGRLPQKSSRYFMEGSSLFLARQETDPAAVLHFEDSFGAFELHHNAHQRSAVFLKNRQSHPVAEKEEWKEESIERMTNHLLQQFQKFPTNEGNRAAMMLQSLEVTIRFGCFYLVDIDGHLPETQKSLQIQELQMSVEKGRRSRKSWSRGEFVEHQNLFVQPTTAATPRYKISFFFSNTISLFQF